MKKAIENIAQMMHHSDPQACFNIDFWDGDVIRFGTLPRVTLRLKTKRCAKRIIKKGFLGFGESYMTGDLEVDNDLKELLRLGLAINYNDYHLPFWQKYRFPILSLLNRDTIRRAPKNISYHYDRGNEFYALYLNNNTSEGRESQEKTD